MTAIRSTRDRCQELLKLFDLLNKKVLVKDVHIHPEVGSG